MLFSHTPFAPIHSFPQELSDYPKETQQSALHVLLLLVVLHRAGCPEQPQASRLDACQGVPCPGGVLHTRPLHNHHSLGPPGAPGWGCQPGRHCFVQSFLLQSRYNGGITLLQVPQMQTSHRARCPCRNMPAGYWLHKLTRAQGCRFCTRTDCNTGEQRPPQCPAGQQMHTSAKRL